MMLVETCLKQVLTQDCCLERAFNGWDPQQGLIPRASKERERTPVGKKQ